VPIARHSLRVAGATDHIRLQALTLLLRAYQKISRLPCSIFRASDSIAREQHLRKTRYQNWPMETDPEDRAFVLSSETRRHRNCAQNAPYSRAFCAGTRTCAKTRTGWLRTQSAPNPSPPTDPC
jgi:hypothetical protein